MTFVRTKLGVVEKPHAEASVFTGPLPLFRGDEQENLLCGGCEAVIGKSISARTLKTRIAVPNQLIAVCAKCGTYNVLPSTLHVEK